ncbi:MAG: type IV pilus modification PilV family protein, partial [Gemmataceae bacterium]
MMNWNHKRRARRGLTLTEALIAMFIAALGLIALMTLFPLGALQMGQALKDERCAQTALQADGLMRWYWKQEVVEKKDREGANRDGLPQHADPLLLALQNPNQNTVTARIDATATRTYTLFDLIQRTAVAPRTIAYPAPPANEVSYPVAIDSIGWDARVYATRPREQSALGGNATDNHDTYIPRRCMRNLITTTPASAGSTYTFGNASTYPADGTKIYSSYTASVSNVVRMHAMLDDLTYEDAGTGYVKGSPNTVERQGRYNWMAILQRPYSAREAYTTANMTICVFDSRAPGYAPTGSELVYPRDGDSVPIALTPGATSVRIYYTTTPPPVAKGRWIM